MGKPLMDNEILQNDDATVTVFAQEGYLHAMLHMPNANTSEVMERIQDEMQKIKEEYE